MVNIPLECLFECDNVLVLKHSQHPYFSHYGLLRDFIIIRFLKLLDANCKYKAKVIATNERFKQRELIIIRKACCKSKWNRRVSRKRECLRTHVKQAIEASTVGFTGKRLQRLICEFDNNRVNDQERLFTILSNSAVEVRLFVLH